jgi:hypothetical protein
MGLPVNILFSPKLRGIFSLETVITYGFYRNGSPQQEFGAYEEFTPCDRKSLLRKTYYINITKEMVDLTLEESWNYLMNKTTLYSIFRVNQSKRDRDDYIFFNKNIFMGS